VSNSTEELTQEVTNRLLARMFNLGVALLFSVLISAVGVGAFFATMQTQVQHLSENVSDLKTVLASDYGVRLRVVEAMIARGVLPEADERLDILEQEVFGKPPRNHNHERN
jgi:hypothetical protein